MQQKIQIRQASPILSFWVAIYNTSIASTCSTSFEWCIINSGSVKYSRTQPNYPSNNSTFCLEWEVNVNIGLTKGGVGEKFSFPESITSIIMHWPVAHHALVGCTLNSLFSLTSCQHEILNTPDTFQSENSIHEWQVRCFK